MADTPNTNTNTALSILSDETKVDSIKTAMRARKVFDSIDDALAALQKAAGETENFHGLPVAIKGIDSEGNVDPAIYENANAALAYVGARIESKGKDKGTTGIKGIVIFPIPKLASFLESDAGEPWLSKIVEKEAALVAFRNFREAATLAEFQSGVEKSPATVEEYVAESARGGAGLDTETFDALWQALRAGIKKDIPALATLLPGKAEVIKAIRSQAYAEAEHGELESKGIFVWLANVIIDAATNHKAKDGSPAPLPTDAIEAWVSGRDSLVLKKAESQAKDFSVLDEIALPGFAQ